MTALTIQAEIIKLSRLLGCPESQLDGLSALDVASLRQLRDACVSSLFDGDRAGFQKVASATKLLPGAIAALIAEKALGPMLCARVAGLLAPKDAVDIAKRTPVAFNTETTTMLDPRSATPMLQIMPADVVVAVAQELRKRSDFVTMGRFVDVMPDASIRAVMEVMDAEAMLRSGFFIESPQRLEEVAQLISPAKLQQLMEVAANPALDLGGAVMSMLGGVSVAQRTRFIDAAASHPKPEVLVSLGQSAREHGMQAPLLEAAKALDAGVQKRVKAAMAS